MNFSPEWTEGGVEYGTRHYAANVATMFERAGVPLIVTATRFQGEPDPKVGHWRTDTHWSRAGHRWRPRR